MGWIDTPNQDNIASQKAYACQKSQVFFSVFYATYEKWQIGTPEKKPHNTVRGINFFLLMKIPKRENVD
jgi:hypothetical protein